MWEVTDPYALLKKSQSTKAADISTVALTKTQPISCHFLCVFTRNQLNVDKARLVFAGSEVQLPLEALGSLSEQNDGAPINENIASNIISTDKYSVIVSLNLRAAMRI